MKPMAYLLTTTETCFMIVTVGLGLVLHILYRVRTRF